MSWLHVVAESEGFLRGFWRRPSTLTLIFACITILAVSTAVLLLPE